MTIKLLLVFILLAAADLAFAQTTEFTYQGRLVDGTVPANSNYDFEFRLCASESNCNLMLGTNQRLGVSVSNGIFTVKLDFGDNFGGQPRWLEIAVRPAGGGSFTTLTPRQPFTSTPYSIRSLNAQAADTATNALNLGGVAASQYVITTDPRMTNARAPTANSDFYINNTISQQSADFNIDGHGTLGGNLSANKVTSQTQYNIGINRMLAATGTGNTFAGLSSGPLTSGDNNSFFGRGAGLFNVSGNNNSFFGRSAGAANTTSNNSFFGTEAGASTTSGSSNAFFGYRAGFVNSTGFGNSFFGNFAGGANTTAANNSFFGNLAGIANTTGPGNSFFGGNAGSSNTTGSDNAFFGFNAGAANTASFNAFFGRGAGAANTTAENNTFVGYLAGESTTVGGENVFFGSRAGSLNTTGTNNTFLGFNAGSANTTGSRNIILGENAGAANTTGGFNTIAGSQSGEANTTGGGNAFFGYFSGERNTTGTANAFFGSSAGNENTTGDSNTAIGSGADFGSGNLSFATAIGAGSRVADSNKIALGRLSGTDTVVVYGRVELIRLGVGGDINLCRNATFQISTCSSSLRYKNRIEPFIKGLDIVRRLSPIVFDWKDAGTRDIGFGAEQVNEIEPLLTTRNQAGEIEGVKYGQITTVLVNAVNEQQAQIEKQKKQIGEQRKLLEEQQRQIGELKRLVCLSHPTSEICRENEEPK